MTLPDYDEHLDAAMKAEMMLLPIPNIPEQRHPVCDSLNDEDEE